ncbi:MAG: hypothetical protein LUE21_05360 [Oscillospiraceae bacterium]|nr:hypothetical protein [Oscillospiraceae bacterium]
MIVKFCPQCSGRPYTTDPFMTGCPICGSLLQTELVSDDALRTRATLPASAPAFDDPFGTGGGTDVWPPKTPEWPSFDNTEQKTSPMDTGSRPEPEIIPPRGIADPPDSIFTDTPPREEYATAKNMDTVIRGRISEYSNTGREGDANYHYRRFWFQKLWDAIAYGQRTDDVLHRFQVRVESGGGDYTNIPVNVHGIIAGGMQLTDNAVVEVSGRYRNGVLMARHIDILNNGYKTTVRLQHSASSIFYVILLAVVAAMLIFVGVSDGGSFFDNIGYFLCTWLIMAGLMLLVYAIFSFSRIGLFMRMSSRKEKRSPFLGILLISLLLALLFVGVFGTGTSFAAVLSALLSGLLPLILVIIGIVLLLKVIGL